MKCKDCKHYKDGVCTAGGDLSQIDDLQCLLKLQIVLLKDIYFELMEENDERDEGDWWKMGEE